MPPTAPHLAATPAITLRELDESHLRQQALGYAVERSLRGDDYLSGAEVVEEAETFLAFLTGEKIEEDARF